MNALARRTIEKNESTPILRRIAERDKTAVQDCIDVYGNFIWALARKFTRSPEAAAKAAEEIFTDIWQYNEHDRDSQSVEEKLIARIALRRLIKPISYAKQTSMSNINAANKQGAGTDGISERV